MDNHLHRAMWAACVVLFLNLAAALPAAAQFSINGPRVDQGKLGFETHGSVQSGLPNGGGVEGEDVGEEGQARYGHEFIVNYGITDFWLLELGFVIEKPEGDDLQASTIELENTFELPTIQPWNTTFAIFVAGAFDVSGDGADVLEFGPLVQFGEEEKTSLILNALFEKSFGENRTEGLGFSYAAQYRSAITKEVGLGFEAFGEIEQIGNVPGFDETELRIGPMLYLSYGDDDDDDKGKKNGKGKGKAKENDGDDSLAIKEPEVEIAVGVLIGATDATPNLTFKWDIEITF